MVFMTVKRPNFSDLCLSQNLDRNSMTMAQEEKLTRKWEIFQGRNRFYCGGRFMTAPNAGVFLLTVFLISGTSTLFFIFDCKYLAENVTIAIPIIGVILFLFTMSSLLRTSLSDPGIIPRATAEEAAYVEKQIEVTNSANSPTYRPPPRTKEVVVKGQTIKLKYCFTCKLFRPPRASHCSICDNCVERFDHHCPWVGNCVGRRNYRFFYMFIISLAFLAVFIFACALAHLILITKEGKFFEAVKDSPASAIIAIICFFSVWSVLGLAGFHTYLTTSNQTTNEDIKGSFTSKRGQDSFNPYSQGNVCLNCFYILCGPVSPSLIDRRGIVTESYRSEINQIINMDTPIQTLLNHTIKQNGSTNLTHHHQSTELPGIYRQTTETTNNAAGSVTHLVANEHPLANAVPALLLQQHQQQQQIGDTTTLMHHYKSHPSLNNSPVYNNINPINPILCKSQSYAENINNNKAEPQKETHNNKPPSSASSSSIDMVKELSLDPVILREKLILNDSSKIKLDNDMTVSDKENSLLSASRLRLLQDTTMIESALDLDSLEESSVSATSQAGLMKIIV